MSIELTEQQRQALNVDSEFPRRVIDPVSNTTYVLLPVGVYHQLQALLDDDVRQLEPLLADLAPEDWEDLANYESRP